MPDVFDIIIEESEISKLEIRSLNTPFGETKEKYLFINCNPVGEVIDEIVTLERLKIDFKNGISILLNQIPTSIKYKANLDDVLLTLSVLSKWAIIYETDCEQDKLNFFNEFEHKLTNLLNFDLTPKDKNIRAFLLVKD